MTNHGKKIFFLVCLLWLGVNARVQAAVHLVQLTPVGFVPGSLTIEAGDTVVWVNALGVTANVAASDGTFRCADTCEIQPGDGLGQPSSTWQFTYVTFNRVETISYSNEAAGISGSVTVVPPVNGQTHTIAASNFSFSPSAVQINPGDVLHLVNNGGFHNFRADDDSIVCAEGCQGSNFNSLRPFSASSAAWDVYVRLFEPGLIPYYCEAHGAPGGVGMSGIVTVLDNYLKNPDFDTDLSWWTLGGAATPVWDAADASGSAASGSALINNTEPNAGVEVTALSQCVPALVGVFHGGILAQIPTGQATSGAVRLQLQYFPASADCSGTPGPSSVAELGQPSNQWQALNPAPVNIDLGQIESGGASVLYTVSIRKDTAGGQFQAWLDQAFMRQDLIYRHGFDPLL